MIRDIHTMAAPATQIQARYKTSSTLTHRFFIRSFMPTTPARARVVVNDLASTPGWGQVLFT
jgi:hypothetical protein